MCGFFCIPSVVAQTLGQDSLPKISFRHLSIGLNSGTSGLGLDAAYRFRQRFCFQTGFSYLATATTNLSATLKGEQANLEFKLNGAVNLNNVPLLLHWDVGKKGKLRVVGGGRYLLKAKNILYATGELKEAVNAGELRISPEDFGKGSLAIGLKTSFLPYLGIGLGKIIPTRRVNLSLDLGVFYQKAYTVTAEIQEGILSKENVQNAALLQRNLNQNKGLRYLPNVNLRLSFRIF